MQNQGQGQVLCPFLRWAQKGDRVFITVMLRDISNEKVQITGDTLKFKGQSNEKNYSIELELYAKMNQAESNYYKTGSNLQFQLRKERNCKWPRVTKENKRFPFILVDWDRWDEESEGQEEDSKDFNESGMGKGSNQAKLDRNFEDDDDDQREDKVSQNDGNDFNEDYYQDKGERRQNEDFYESFNQK